MEGEARAVFVERSGLCLDDGGAEGLQTSLLAQVKVKPIPSTAVVGPVGNTHQALAAELQILPASDQLHLLEMNVNIAAKEVELVTHVGGDRGYRQT